MNRGIALVKFADFSNTTMKTNNMIHIHANICEMFEEWPKTMMSLLLFAIPVDTSEGTDCELGVRVPWTRVLLSVGCKFVDIAILGRNLYQLISGGAATKLQRGH